MRDHARKGVEFHQPPDLTFELSAVQGCFAFLDMSAKGV